VTFWREPKFDAAWRERGDLLDRARVRAIADQNVKQRGAAARDAFDAFLADPSDESGETFWCAVLEVVDAAVAAARPLRELAIAGSADEPPQLAREIAVAIVHERVARDQHPLAVDMLRVYERDHAGRLPRVMHLWPLAQLRHELDVNRVRGRPGGTRRRVPESFPDLLVRLRPVVEELRRKDMRISVQAIAAYGGWDERLLRDAFTHHGVKGGELMRVIRRSARR
jgi:hypothetical protein